MAVAILGGLLLNLVHVALDIGRERERMQDNGAGIIALVEGSAARAAYTFDTALAETVIDSLIALPAVVEARLESNLGRVLAQETTDKAPLAFRWMTDAIFGPTQFHDQVFFTPPSPAGLPPPNAEDPIGTLVMGLDTRVLAADLLQRSFRLFMLGILKTAFLAVALLAVAHWLVTRPIARLVSEVETMDPETATGPALKAPQGHDDDELGRVADAINGLSRKFREAEEARKATDMRLHAAAGSIPDGLAIVDPDGAIRFMNAQFVRHSPEGLLPTSKTVVQNLQQMAYMRPFVEFLPPALFPGAPVFADLPETGDAEARLDDGRVIRIRWAPAPDGCHVFLSTDITKRLKMAQELDRSERLAAMGTLAGGVAHDFNNILATIYSSAELAKTLQSRDSPALKPLERILDAGRRGRTLVDQVLTFSRSERDATSQTNFARSVVAAMELCKPGLGPATRITVKTTDTDIWINATETQVLQIISNLLTNAAQASGRSGTIEVAVDAHDESAVLSVSDHGTGMDAYTKGRAIEPFFTTKPVGEGTGLGLAVVYGILRSLGGTLDIDSTPGHGTCVIVQIPLAQAKGTAIPA